MRRLLGFGLALLVVPAASAEIRIERGADGKIRATNASHGAYAPAPARTVARQHLVQETPDSDLPAHHPMTAPVELERLIREVATETRLPADLIRAVAAAESSFDPAAVSRKGARGLMQLMPATAAAYGVEDVHDPRENLIAGSRHLGDLLRSYDGNLKLALAAYNAGPQAVRRYGGVPPYKETETYIARVLSRYHQAREAAPSPAPDPRRLHSYRDASGRLVMSNLAGRSMLQPVRVAEISQ